MLAYVFSTVGAANACTPVVDAHAGYPRPGRDIGGGVHVRPPFRTLTYAGVRKHPTLPQWAYPADAVTTAALASHAAALGLPVPVALDASWTPAPTAV